MSNKTGKTLIKGGRVVDPKTNKDQLLDVLIEDEVIQAVDTPQVLSSIKDATVVEAKGCLVVPGLIDIHVHLREPGQEWKETVETGSRAAVAGGVTAVCCMPNTKPANDSSSVTKFILKQAQLADLCRVYPVGAITLERAGQAMAPYLELKEAGCVALSDDGRSVASAQIMRRALEYNSMLGLPLAVHEEDESLAYAFAMNESALSLKMGLKGMPSAAEDVMIARDIELARLTKGHVHFCHVSTARAVTLIRRAKEDGIPVTAEAAIHNLILDESAVRGFNTNAKMSMPLRTEEDVRALRQGVREGVIDCIVSDHAPHETDSKNVEFDRASFGIIGLQSLLPLVCQLVRDKELSLTRALEALTAHPAKVFHLPGGSLSKGGPADVTIIDPERKMKLVPEIIRSKSRNTPFMNWELQGVAVKTFVKGREVFDIQGL